MRAKIRKQRGRWSVSTVDGGRECREVFHGSYATLREATQVKATLVGDAARGRYVAPDKLTVADYLVDEWLPSRENADISPGTRDLDRTTVAAWIIPHIGDIPLQKLSARDLDKLYRTLRERGGRGGRPLRGKSVRNVHGLLSKALGDAVRRGHLATNPILAVDPPARDDSVERVAWTRAEVRRFLAVASSDRLGGVFRLALATGVRRGELLGLSWNDCDFAARTITIRRQVLLRAAKDARRVYVRETTKTRRVRKVTFDEQTAVALRRWKAQQAEEKLAFGSAYKLDGGLGVELPWIVTEPDGAVVHPDTLLSRWKSLVAATATFDGDGKVVLPAVPAIPLHGARHSFATLLLEAGERLDVVSSSLGHASIATTANVYGHVSEDAATQAAERIGSVLG